VSATDVRVGGLLRGARRPVGRLPELRPQRVSRRRRPGQSSSCRASGTIRGPAAGTRGYLTQRPHPEVEPERSLYFLCPRLRDEKYAVQRFAKAIGAFPASAGPDVVAVRLDSCPDA
jgi:hypothetical protein